MADSLQAKRLESLLNLSRRLAGEAGGGLLGDALDLATSCSAAAAGAAFSMGESLDQVAERGLAKASSNPEAAGRLRRMLRAIAGRAVSSRRLVRIDDAASQIGEVADVTWRSIIAIPIAHRRTVLGVLLMIFDDDDDADQATIDFAETISSMVALAVDRDRRIEEERAHRAEVDESHRIASIGLLTASVAHELRGPVGALALQMQEQKRLLGELEMLSGGSEPAIGAVLSDLSELRDDVNVAVRRVRDTITQLTTLGKRESDHEELDVGSVIRDALWITRPQLERRGITIIEELDRNCYTTGRRDNLAQVVLNLVLNAADACERSSRPSREVRVSVRQEAENIVLSVDDTGPGVPSDAVKKIFQPFYTTKQSGRGTGLGLKICSDVVAAHGGHIEVVNRQDGGATFRVVLPRADAGAPVSDVPSTGRRDTFTKRVLVIDDDEVFARTMRRALKPHDVRIAHTASEGEIALLDPAYSPDLVMCDVFLPGVNGDELHRRVKSSRPKIADRFLFVTGGALSKREADYLKASSCPTLFKPLDLKDVLAHLGVTEVESVPPSIRTLTRSSSPAGEP